MLNATTERFRVRLAQSRALGAAPAAMDATLLWVVALLMVSGAVMVYSASIALPDAPRFSRLSSWHFLVRHLFSISIGISLAFLAFAVPMDQWQRWSMWLFGLGLVLLVLVLIPHIGKTVLGARRWIPLGAFNLQPSELMKLFVILYAADYAVRRQDVISRWVKGTWPIAAAVAAVAILLMWQPDFGAFVVIAAVAMGILFLAGVSASLFTSMLLLVGGIFTLIIALSPWRRERIFAYLDPFSAEFALGKGYQLTHALIALGRGEVFGVGLGASVEKLHYLPEAHTDFLLAVIGEELGLAAVMLIIVAFFWIVRRAVEIGRLAIKLDRPYGGLVAQGIGLWIGFQAFINIGVNTGLLPTKGLTLPLMSYGGSAIIVNCIAIAILLRVDFENRRLMRGGG
jgi:cell division protein FtsW